MTGRNFSGLLFYTLGCSFRLVSKFLILPSFSCHGSLLNSAPMTFLQIWFPAPMPPSTHQDRNSLPTPPQLIKSIPSFLQVSSSTYVLLLLSTMFFGLSLLYNGQYGKLLELSEVLLVFGTVERVILERTLGSRWLTNEM